MEGYENIANIANIARSKVTTTMSDAIRVFPNVEDVFACCELECQFLDGDTLEGCKKRGCPFSHQRLREENRIKDDAAREKERMRDEQ